MNKILSNLINLIYPPKCHVCLDILRINIDTGYICGECLDKDIFIDSENICKKCGVPCLDGSMCLRCEQKSFAFECGFGVFSYDLIKESLDHFKFRGFKNDGIGFYHIMYDYIVKNHYDEFQKIDIILPVPMHYKKKIKRGFNQAEILAKGLAEVSGKEYYEDVLIRTRDTLPQSSLSAKERIKNVKGAFIVANKECILNKNILIVDDIFTMGETINECTKQLYINGVNTVCFYTLCIAG